MKLILLSLMLISYIEANSQVQKIDMHGGKFGAVYEKKGVGFKSKSFGLSSFLDTNSSKKLKKKEKK